MSEQTTKEFDKKIVLVCREGQWSVTKVEIRPGALPLVSPDVHRIARVVRIEVRKRMRDLKLAQVLSVKSNEKEQDHVGTAK